MSKAVWSQFATARYPWRHVELASRPPPDRAALDILEETMRVAKVLRRWWHDDGLRHFREREGVSLFLLSSLEGARSAPEEKASENRAKSQVVHWMFASDYYKE